MFKYEALVNICKIYLIQLKESNNLNLIDEIQPYIKQIKDIAENYEVHSLLVELYSLNSKLKLISFNFVNAQEKLTQGLEIATKYGLIELSKRLEAEKVNLTKNFLKWEKLKKSRSSILECMKLARVDEQIEILLQKRNYFKAISIKSQQKE